jgi:hypothetical protein
MAPRGKIRSPAGVLEPLGVCNRRNFIKIVRFELCILLPHPLSKNILGGEARSAEGADSPQPTVPLVQVFQKTTVAADLGQ